MIPLDLVHLVHPVDSELRPSGVHLQMLGRSCEIWYAVAGEHELGMAESPPAPKTMRKHGCLGIAKRCVLFCGLPFVLSGCRTSHDDLKPSQWAEKTIGWVRSAETLEAHVLDIFGGFNGTPGQSDSLFGGYKIIGRTVEIDSERREKLLIALQEGLEQSRAEGYPIYTALPNVSVGVRAIADGNSKIDVVFCLEAGRCVVILDDGVRHPFPMGKAPRDVLNEILADANIDDRVGHVP